MQEYNTTTGFYWIDRKYPIHMGSLVVIGGRPGIGKTSLLRTIYDVANVDLLDYIDIECSSDVFGTLFTIGDIAKHLGENEDKCKPGKLVIIDYAQLIDGQGSTFEQIVNRLKMIAGNTATTIFLAAQLNKTADRRPGGVPTVEDIDDALYQACDQLWLLSREIPKVMTVNIAKNRHGATGTIPMYFDPDVSREVRTMTPALEENEATV